MPRIRTIKPSFFTSEDSGMWSDATKVVFMGLISQASDNGIGSANPRFLVGQILPYQDQQEALMKVHEALLEAQGAGSVVLFRRADRDFYWLRNWADHQYVQNPSKGLPALPSPEEIQAYEDHHDAWMDAPTRENTPPTLTLMKPHESSGAPHEAYALEGKGREGKGREGKDTPSTSPTSVSSTAVAVPVQPPLMLDVAPPVASFEDFWFACPRKVGKGAAEASFGKAVARGAAPGQIVGQMQAMAQYWRDSRTEPKYIPHPATWLNQARYEDPIPVVTSTGPQTARARNLAHTASLVEKFAAMDAAEAAQRKALE